MSGAYAGSNRDWESVFAQWASPPSQTEQERCANAEKAVRNAIGASQKLQGRNIKVFTHGSFRNRVNVRRESDVDVGIVCFDTFHPSYPEGVTAKILEHSDAGYDYKTFKNEVEAALVDYFGRAAVVRGKKAFDVRENSYHVEADVAPFFEHRRYWSGREGAYQSGVVLWPDDGGRIINWPEQHYENGVAKNDRTSKAYKGLVRIFKCIRNEMADAGIGAAAPIPGFLLECLAWNVPDEKFSRSTWEAVVQEALLWLWSNTKDDATCGEWGEVSELKYLFRGQKWTRDQVHAFIDAAWTYVGVR